MSKRLVSFRFDEDRIEELRELADVYTNGNTTKLLEHLITPGCNNSVEFTQGIPDGAYLDFKFHRPKYHFGHGRAEPLRTSFRGLFSFDK